MATILDGKAVGQRIRGAVKEQVAKLEAETGRVPGLATVLVGDDAASGYYVRSKHRACSQVGIRPIGHELPTTTTQAEIETLVRQLSEDDAIDGILVQLPLPDGLDENAVIDAIAPAKDVDGLHPVNLGNLAARGREPYFIPATPLGIMTLLAETGTQMSGKRAVVIGRSNLVGQPTSLLLQNANVTVTVCHSHTQALTAHLREADIVVVAIGRANYVTGDMLKPGCIVIDVGINEIEDASRKKGYRLVGDVEYDSAAQVASHITPVPGGVGPMTIAMLLQNTLKSAERRTQGT